MESIAPPPALIPNSLGIHTRAETNCMDTAICRVCMAKDGVMVNIFEAPPESNTSIAVMISECTGIYISHGQAYPKTICRTCVLDAQNAYEFKKTFERSQQHFSRIKEEVCIISDSDEETVQEKDEFEICLLEEEEPRLTDQMMDEPTEGPLLVEDQLLVSDISKENPSEGTDDRDDNAPSPAADRQFMCSQCQKSFIRKQHLNRHMRIHAGERPFQCEYCLKFFTQKSVLKKHLQTHTGDRPFKCSLCPKTFTQKFNLQSHFYMHTGERPYKCSQCPKSYTQQANLRNHVRKHDAYHRQQSLSDRSNLQRDIRIHTKETQDQIGLKERQ